MRCTTSYLRIALLAGLTAAAPATAQLRVDTPGAAFTVKEGHARADDGAGGRRFRGDAHDFAVLQGLVRLPPAAQAELSVQKIVVRFRGSGSFRGATLRGVKLLSTVGKGFETTSQLTGDQSAETLSNSWNLKKARCV